MRYSGLVLRERKIVPVEFFYRPTAEEAHRLYQNACLKYYGELPPDWS